MTSVKLAIVAPSGEKGKISWRAILSRPDLGALMIGYFCFGYIAWIFFSWFFIYMAQVRGLNLKASALVSSDSTPGTRLVPPGLRAERG